MIKRLLKKSKITSVIYQLNKIRKLVFETLIQIILKIENIKLPLYKILILLKFK